MSSRRFTATDAALLSDVMRHRRDSRGNDFTDQPISDAEIDSLIDAALLGPSVGFSQPWEFVVIRNDDTKRQVQKIFTASSAAEAGQFAEPRQARYRRLKLEGIGEAPVNLAVFYKPSGKPVLGQTAMPETGRYSVVCAVQNMWLMARAMNIGMGWVSILEADKINMLVGVPEDRQLVAYLCVGRVAAFAEKPELETLRWETRKLKQSVVYRERFDTKFYD